MGKFESEMNRARVMKEAAPDQANYWDGYIRGLRRAHHGENFGEPGEHEKWLSLADDDRDESRRQLGEGYRDGLEMKSGVIGRPKKFAKNEMVGVRLDQAVADRCPRNDKGNVDKDFLREAVSRELERRGL